MPKANVKKTKWAPKVTAFAIAASIVIAVAILSTKHSHQKIIHIGNTTFSTTIADTAITREQGLSGRKSLSSDDAMLFTFDTAAVQCFWMKNMRFPLDILWFNSQKQLIYTRQNLSPKTYPKTFCPHSPTRYVVETKAGTVRRDHIQLGADLLF